MSTFLRRLCWSLEQYRAGYVCHIYKINSAVNCIVHWEANRTKRTTQTYSPTADSYRRWTTALHNWSVCVCALVCMCTDEWCLGRIFSPNPYHQSFCIFSLVLHSTASNFRRRFRRKMECKKKQCVAGSSTNIVHVQIVVYYEKLLINWLPMIMTGQS